MDFFQDAHDAIDKLKLWDFIAKDPGEGGFMFSSSPEIQSIMKEMKYIGYHSGASFGSLMRELQYFALYKRLSHTDQSNK
jgi:hypothetical protein